MAEYRAGEAERELRRLEERLREMDEESGEIVSRMAESIGAQALRLDDLEALERQLRASGSEVQLRRQQILETLESSPEFVREPGQRYRELDAEITDLGLEENALSSTLRAYEESQEEVQGQLLRLRRADTSIEVFAGIPVTICPACEQPVSPAYAGEFANTCYLCSQEVSPDVRRRRVELEIGALQRELAEISEVALRTKEELEDLRTRRGELERKREELRVGLDQQRAELIAPYLSELEALSEEAGALGQQLSTLRGLHILVERRSRLLEELEQARARLESAEAEARDFASQRRVAEEQCARLADLMNRFFASVRSEPWRFGNVTVTEEELRFYVGTRRWETALGAEAKVLFFLAYHGALMQFPSRNAARSPKLAILDNPLQHGISEAVVAEALDLLADLAREQESQLIVTLPRDLPLTRDYSRIELTQQYASDGRR